MRARGCAILLIGCALLLALMAVAVWQRWLWSPARDGLWLSVPIGGAHELHVAIWAWEVSTAAPPGWLPLEVERRFAVPVPVTVAIWYQNRASMRTIRLLRATMPAWPLALLAGAV